MNPEFSFARIRRRVSYLAHRGRLDAELREEIEAHRMLRQRQFEAEGMTVAAAEAASRAAMGNVLVAREDARDVWLGSLTAVIQELRFGARLLRGALLVAIIVVLTMTLFIGRKVGMTADIGAVWRQQWSLPDAAHQVWAAIGDSRQDELR